MSTLKTQYHNFIGIDISKKDFIICIYGNKNIEIYSNTQEGWQQFVAKYDNLIHQALIVMETTGGYEMGLLLYLISKGISVHRADTRKVKNFIRSWGKYGKTDKIDAQSIALYAYERQGHLNVYQAQDTIQAQLKLLTERRQDLVEMLVKEKNRSKAPLANSLADSYKKMISTLEEQIKEIDNGTVENRGISV